MLAITKQHSFYFVPVQSVIAFVMYLVHGRPSAHSVTPTHSAQYMRLEASALLDSVSSTDTSRSSPSRHDSDDHESWEEESKLITVHTH